MRRSNHRGLDSATSPGRRKRDPALHEPTPRQATTLVAHPAVSSTIRTDHTEGFNAVRSRHNSEPVADLAALRKARSMLILLLATCKESLLALEAAANVLDTDLTSDLAAMIARSEKELVALNAKIEELGD